MSYIIDRRSNSKKKSTVNRQRFMRRYKSHIKKAVEKAIKGRSITEVDQGGKISIPNKDINEPFFHHGQGGLSHRVYPGNKEFVVGDEFERPQGEAGGGAGQGKASDQGEGEDEFTFQIDQEEFLEFMFNDMELPYLVKKKLKQTKEYETRRAGFTNAGSPEKIHIVRSLKAAHARRIALGGKTYKEYRAKRKELAKLRREEPDNQADIERIQIECDELKARLKHIPFIDDFDIKYNNLVRVPVPSSRAVMICLMDVSGSMTQYIKDIAKRFFILLYLFLKRNYKHIDVVFIRHHTQAKEVDEQEFFYSRETGGTIVSSALKKACDVIDERYPPEEWNIYVAQASDGDNWDGDSRICHEILDNKLLDLVQYFAYVEITSGSHQNLWVEYEAIKHKWPDVFAMQQIVNVSDIYPALRKLFEKKMSGAA